MSTVPTTNPNPCPSPKKNELEKVFNRFDANGDGKISSSELSGVMTALGSTTSDEEIRRVMEEVDTDRDGFVSLAEFTAFYGGGGAAGDLEDAFDMYDGDNNGLISAPELLLVLTRLGEKFSVDDCSKMIKTFDSDGDGSVSFEEFKKMMTATPSPSSSK